MLYVPKNVIATNSLPLFTSQINSSWMEHVNVAQCVSAYNHVNFFLIVIFICFQNEKTKSPNETHVMLLSNLCTYAFIFYQDNVRKKLI